MSANPLDDPARIRELFDLRSEANQWTGGGYRDDPYPTFHALRQSGPVHPGRVHELLGWASDIWWPGVPHYDRPHFAAFSYEACEQAFRDGDTFATSPVPLPKLPSVERGDIASIDHSILSMGGAPHRRYRALVQPSFTPRNIKWWVERWIEKSVHELIDAFAPRGEAELNAELCALIPIQTIIGSFGIPTDMALEVREAVKVGQPIDHFVELLEPLIADRRERRSDDLISVLVDAEHADEDGTVHRLTDAEILAFAHFLLLAGSGTTWKQMGITLACLLQRLELLAQVQADRSLLRPVIEEAIRWNVTDPVFPRYLTKDHEFHGVHLPAGAVLHVCLAAGNRDPARWDDPDTFDPGRRLRPSLGFGGGSHTCLGIHVARAEIETAIGAVLDRLPDIHIDTSRPVPRVVGLYERGMSEIPVRFAER